MAETKLEIRAWALNGGAAVLGLFAAWHTWMGFRNCLLLVVMYNSSVMRSGLTGTQLPDHAPFLARLLASSPAAVFPIYFLVSSFLLACALGLLLRKEWARKWLGWALVLAAAVLALLWIFPGLLVPDAPPGIESDGLNDFLQARRGAVFILRLAGGTLAVISAASAWFLGSAGVKKLFSPATPPGAAS